MGLKLRESRERVVGENENDRLTRLSSSSVFQMK